jgi:hypothetical protein
MSLTELAEIAEYNRGYRDGASNRGFDDRSTNTKDR